MYFFPKLNAGNYNSIVQANDRGIFAFYPLDTNAVTLTCWATTRVGVRCASTSSTATFVDIWAGNYNLKIDSSSGIVASANNWISNNPDFAVLNNIKSRGIRFISQADTGGSNPFVVQTDAVITTQSQNSSLVLTSANSALNFGIRISSSSTSVGSIVSRVASNSITTNQTNTTIEGPVTMSGNVTVSGSTQLNGGVLLSTTTMLNNNLLQYGSAIINQDITGTYSGTNQFKNSNFLFGLSTAGNLTFGDSTVQTTAFNSTALGYTRVGSTFTYPSNTIINCAVGGIGNEIRCHKFNCYNIIEYPDGSIQNTAYTNAKDTKLTAIGTVITATLTASTLLTTGTFLNCGSVTLSAGTWILTMNCGLVVVTGSTTIGQILTSHSTSSTALSTNANLNINNKNGATYAAGLQFVLPNQAIVIPSTSTTYYLLVQASFGTANRLQFSNGTSSFSAIRIA
jgi:phage baseplate assembly protein gpV